MTQSQQTGMKRVSKAQMEVLRRMAKPCEVEGWPYGPLSHPYWDESRTYRSLIHRGLIARDDIETRTRQGWVFKAYVCVLTPAGRALVEASRGR